VETLSLSDVVLATALVDTVVIIDNFALAILIGHSSSCPNISQQYCIPKQCKLINHFSIGVIYKIAKITIKSDYASKVSGISRAQLIAPSMTILFVGITFELLRNNPNQVHKSWVKVWSKSDDKMEHVRV